MFKEIYKKIEEYDTIVIARHIGVDPDALASQLALRDSIKLTFPNKKVSAIGTGSAKFYSIGKLDKLEKEDMQVFAKKVAAAIKSAFPCIKVGQAVIGLEVPHAHIHLIPIQKESDMLFSNPKLKLSAEEFKEIAEKLQSNCR